MAAHRYWRIRPTTTSNGTSWGLSEIDLWEGRYGPSALARVGWSIINSTTSSGSAAALADGSVSGANVWATGISGAFWGVDFGVGVEVELHRVSLWGMSGGGNSYLLDGVVESSDDGSSWTTEWTLGFIAADYERVGANNAPAVSVRPSAPVNPDSTPLSPRFGVPEYILDPAAPTYSDNGTTPIADGQGVYLSENLSGFSGADDFVQTSSGLRPIWRASGDLDFPFLECDGTKRFGNVAWAQPANLGTIRPYMGFAVVGDPARTGNPSFWGATGGNNKAGFYLRPGNADAEIRIFKTAFALGNYDADSRVIAAAALSVTTCLTNVDRLWNRISSATNSSSAAVSSAEVLHNSGVTGDPSYEGDLYYLMMFEGSSAVDFDIISEYLYGKYVVGFGSDVELAPPSGELEIDGGTPTIQAGAEIVPASGALEIAGGTPELATDLNLSPPPGLLELTGSTPQTSLDFLVEPPSGALSIGGGQPGVYIGWSFSPAPGELEITGSVPLVTTDSGTLASQAAILALSEPPPPPARASQAAVLVLAEPPPPPTRASQAAGMAIGEIVPDVQFSQAAVLALAYGTPCVTRRADFWKITRRDGVVLAYTSHDESVVFQGVLHRACKSLNPTASEEASSLGNVGNLDLQGLISDDAITEADLYGGLFDDAFVEVWRAPWDLSIVETPVRIAAGWCGSLSHGDTGFSMEVLGPGTRLAQKPLVQVVTPGCRREFGSPQDAFPPGGCGVNAEALAIEGQALSVSNRARFRTDVTDPETAPQWANGTLLWLSGPNEGVRCETKEVDFSSGEISLWSPPPFLPNPGDTFRLKPGCDKTPETCKLYGNYINYGGFADVPGEDAILEAPDAKY